MMDCERVVDRCESGLKVFRSSADSVEIERSECEYQIYIDIFQYRCTAAVSLLFLVDLTENTSPPYQIAASQVYYVR